MKEITITASNFESEVLNSDRPVLVDFWAAWCGPCRMLAPAVAKLADEHPEINVGKVNVDEEAELSAAFGIVSIPTLILFDKGQPVRHTMGAQPYEMLEDFINNR
jgi:thioredoxin 1